MVRRILNSSVFLLCIHLIVPEGSSAQVFSYEKLQGKSVQATQNDINIDSEEYYSNKLPAFAEASMPGVPALLKIKISTDPLMYHWCNDSLQFADDRNKTEFLEAFGEKLSIDEMIRQNANGLKVDKMEYVKFTGTTYYFTFGERSFIVLCAQQRRFYRNRQWYYMFLLELDHGRLKNYFAFLNAPEDTINCFGDFNNDGKLDYIDWREKEGVIRIFSLSGDHFVKDKSHFIIVKPTRADLQYMRSGEVPPKFKIIDSGSSKWWYPL